MEIPKYKDFFLKGLVHYVSFSSYFYLLKFREIIINIIYFINIQGNKNVQLAKLILSILLILLIFRVIKMCNLQNYLDMLLIRGLKSANNEGSDHTSPLVTKNL